VPRGKRRGFPRFLPWLALTLAFSLGLLLAGTGSGESRAQSLEAPPVSGLADYGGLPDGEGREHVFLRCSVCHSVMLVRQQRLSREDWDELLDWMVEDQGMAPVEGGERRLLLDYLGTYLGRDVPR
jgi:hypothetical protein